MTIYFRHTLTDWMEQDGREGNENEYEQSKNGISLKHFQENYQKQLSLTLTKHTHCNKTQKQFTV